MTKDRVKLNIKKWKKKKKIKFLKEYLCILLEITFVKSKILYLHTFDRECWHWKLWNIGFVSRTFDTMTMSFGIRTETICVGRYNNGGDSWRKSGSFVVWRQSARSFGTKRHCPRQQTMTRTHEKGQRGKELFSDNKKNKSDDIMHVWYNVLRILPWNGKY